MMEENKILTYEELSKTTDLELLDLSKQNKSSKILSAFALGLMAGIIGYSIINKSVGIFLIIPLFFIYKLVQNSKKNKDLDLVLKERNLK